MALLLAKLHLTIPEKDIFYVSWNLDACDGLGILQTDDAKCGKVTIFTPDCQLQELYAFIDGQIADGIDIKIDYVEN